MASVAGVPGLSALLAWPTDHLTEAAAHWESVGERSYGVAHGVWSDALTVDWRGEAAEALRTDTHADLMTTSGVVDQLQEAASVARSGASDLEAARSQVRYAVEDARSRDSKWARIFRLLTECPVGQSLSGPPGRLPLRLSPPISADARRS